jgi:hypothetical protein
VVSTYLASVEALSSQNKEQHTGHIRLKLHNSLYRMSPPSEVSVIQSYRVSAIPLTVPSSINWHFQDLYSGLCFLIILFFFIIFTFTHMWIHCLARPPTRQNLNISISVVRK